jgi:hypothetical protein
MVHLAPLHIMLPRFDELMRAGLGGVGHRPACDRPPATGVHVAGLRARVIEHAVSRPRTRWSEARYGRAPRQRWRPGSATHREGCAGRCIAASSCSSLIGSPSRVTKNLGLRGLGHIGRTPYVGGRGHLSSVKKPAPRRLRAGFLPHVELAPESCQQLHRSGTPDQSTARSTRKAKPSAAGAAVPLNARPLPLISHPDRATRLWIRPRAGVGG